MCPKSICWELFDRPKYDVTFRTRNRSKNCNLSNKNSVSNRFPLPTLHPCIHLHCSYLSQQVNGPSTFVHCTSSLGWLHIIVIMSYVHVHWAAAVLFFTKNILNIRDENDHLKWYMAQDFRHFWTNVRTWSHAWHDPPPPSTLIKYFGSTLFERDVLFVNDCKKNFRIREFRPTQTKTDFFGRN